MFLSAAPRLGLNHVGSLAVASGASHVFSTRDFIFGVDIGVHAGHAVDVGSVLAPEVRRTSCADAAAAASHGGRSPL